VSAIATLQSASVGRARLATALRHAARLIGSLALTFFGLTVITFCLARVLPIDPVLAIVGDRAPMDVYNAMYRKLGLDLPLYQQYWHYVVQLAHGDFGISNFTNKPVIEDLIHRFPATFELATIAIVIGVIFGVPMGVLAAASQGRWPDHVMRIVGLIGYSMPVFWLGLVGLLIFYGQLGWVSGPGRVESYYEDIVEPVTGLMLIDSLIGGEIDIFWNAVSHIILPASILGYLSLAYIARMTRSFMLSQLSQEYILTALVKGLSRGRVIWRHALGNIMVPLITVIALSYGYLLEGAVLTETVFSWTGIGRYLQDSLRHNDINAVLGTTILIGAMYVTLNLLSDLFYYIIDPRSR
jgi:peptide/nickel transport system permease protein